MRKVVTIGETVLDIIFRQDNPVAAKPGGSMLNASVSLGRSGIPVALVSETGNDRPSRMITDFLRQNNVSTEYIQQYENISTPIALAFLDENSDAEYSFFRNFPDERLTLTLPVLAENDILLFGSFFSISRDIRPKLVRFLRAAREKEALIIYDPNFRKSHRVGPGKANPWISENLSFADIVRCSDEDCRMIFGTTEPEQVFAKIEESGCRNVILTRNRQSVESVHLGTRATVPVPVVDPVSTIGAGDGFNAGIAWFLATRGIKRQDLPGLQMDDWKSMISAGISFASDVCLGYENYISTGFSEKLKK